MTSLNQRFSNWGLRIPWAPGFIYKMSKKWFKIKQSFKSRRCHLIVIFNISEFLLVVITLVPILHNFKIDVKFIFRRHTLYIFKQWFYWETFPIGFTAMGAIDTQVRPTEIPINLHIDNRVTSITSWADLLLPITKWMFVWLFHLPKWSRWSKYTKWLEDEWSPIQQINRIWRIWGTIQTLSKSE